MPKYFIQPENIDQGNKRVFIGGDNADHLITAMRARRGDPVTVCDGRCMDYQCEITDILPGKDKRLELRILSARPVREPRPQVTLYQALPRGDKMEYVIQKCVEMGVHEIVPIYTDNSEIKNLSEAKLHRYRKISEASAKQSMRGIIPDISSPIPLEQAVAAVGHGLVFAPYENELRTGLKEFLSNHNMSVINSAAFFIGSEGGFSDREAELFIQAGIPRVSLGTRILRTETAGFAVLTILMYSCDELVPYGHASLIKNKNAARP